ncbi:hypothetical protein CIT292_10409 [Citrobacter youngae ATCC 29220]|uniref:Uncharacterized protein n=1 Tax=Citrobacter youngae ATCC 29220 TaxID=500640 RepID=D4BIP2_9ENTR|nr:hypothetical protein CIT292_10409 [Citrobacter youngae ATCC 29220]
MRGIRQNGNGDGGRHRQYLIFSLWAITEIINNDGEFASKNGCCEGQYAGKRE